MSSAGLRARGLGIRFLVNRQKRLVTPSLARLRRGTTESWGLRDVTFDVGPGEAVALIGESGSGKTSLLRAIAGVYEPDEGTIEVDGEVGSLLSVNAGLMTSLTGRENVGLLGTLAGVPFEEARASEDAIAVATDLEEAFDRPTGSYSQGMRARLGFAVADHAGTSVLVLDEVHEALDHRFRAIVRDRALALLAEGGIVVAAGHDHPLLEQMCDRAFLMERGHIVDDGPFETVRRHYLG